MLTSIDGLACIDTVISTKGLPIGTDGVIVGTMLNTGLSKLGEINTIDAVASRDGKTADVPSIGELEGMRADGDASGGLASIEGLPFVSLASIGD